MRYAIGVGSNLADREEHIARGRSLLAPVHLVAASSLREFPAVGGPPGQDDYLNGVWVVETGLPAALLVRHLLTIEARCGRQRPVPCAPRTLDLDCLLSDPPTMIHERDCQLPHPRLHLRAFVMRPLLEMVPDWFHPVLGCRLEEIDEESWR